MLQQKVKILKNKTNKKCKQLHRWLSFTGDLISLLKSIIIPKASIFFQPGLTALACFLMKTDYALLRQLQNKIDCETVMVDSCMPSFSACQLYPITKRSQMSRRINTTPHVNPGQAGGFLLITMTSSFGVFSLLNGDKLKCTSFFPS